MKGWVFFVAALAMAGPAAGKDSDFARQTITSLAEPPKSDAEGFITSLTWPTPQAGPFAPHDECGGLDDAYDFRLELGDAVLKRDTDALLALSSPDIRLDFGGGEGREELRVRLDAAGGGLWEELARLMPLGCAPNSSGGLTLPWYFEQPMATEDPFSAMIVMGQGVPLRGTAVADGPVIENLDWEEVAMVGPFKPEEPFQMVTPRGGVVGYVPTDRLHALLDYRLLAQRRGGKWAVTALLAGD